MVAQGLDQFGQRLSSQPTFEWSTVSAPANSNPTITTDQGIATYTFNRAGTYTVKAVSGSIVRTAQINVQQTLTSGKISSDGSAVSNGQTLSVSTSTQRITAEGFDQFGNKLTAAPTWTWSATSATSGASATFATANGVTTATFNRAATYAITARSGSIVLNFNTAVSQTFTRIGLFTAEAPTGNGISSTTIEKSSQRFIAQALDQFGRALSTQPTIAWSQVRAPANAESTISATSDGASVDFNKIGDYTFRTVSGNIEASLSVKVIAKLSRLGFASSTGESITSGQTVATTSSSARVILRGYDQFDELINGKPTANLTFASPTSGATASFTSTADGSNITLNRASRVHHSGNGGNCNDEFQTKCIAGPIQRARCFSRRKDCDLHDTSCFQWNIPSRYAAKGSINSGKCY